MSRVAITPSHGVSRVVQRRTGGRLELGGFWFCTIIIIIITIAITITTLPSPSPSSSPHCHPYQFNISLKNHCHEQNPDAPTLHQTWSGNISSSWCLGGGASAQSFGTGGKTIVKIIIYSNLRWYYECHYHDHHHDDDQEFSPLSPAPLTSSRSMDWGPGFESDQHDNINISRFIHDW